MFKRRIHPYLDLARVSKPTGTYLLFLPSAWSLSMAYYANTHLTLPTLGQNLALFGAGAFIMRSAGCTINDLLDRNIDKKVARTSERPIAKGTLTPFQGLKFLGVLLTAGLGILTQLNLYSIALGASSLVLVGTYPLMKRITNWPQTFLGLTMSWGALLGWSAMTGFVNWGVCLPLYASGVFWTLFYDTIYALQDRSCDIKAGIKSSAVALGSRVEAFLVSMSVCQVACLTVAGWMNEQGFLYFTGVGGAAAHLAWICVNLKSKDVADAGTMFRKSVWTGVIITMGILSDALRQRLNLRTESSRGSSRITAAP